MLKQAAHRRSSFTWVFTAKQASFGAFDRRALWCARPNRWRLPAVRFPHRLKHYGCGPVPRSSDVLSRVPLRVLLFGMTFSRIMIIGGPGSGKTWLARRHGESLDLPVHSVDDAVWDPDGIMRPADGIDNLVRDLAARDRWIIEGGNSRTYADRARRAHAIIRLLPPLWLRFYRVLRRDGLRRERLWWTLRYDSVFGAKDRDAMALGRDTAICIEIRSARDLNRLIDEGIENFRFNGPNERSG